MRVTMVALVALAMALGCSDATQPASNPPRLAGPGHPQTPSAPRPEWTGCGSAQQRLYQEAVPIYQASYDYHSGILESEYTLCGDGRFRLAFMSGRWGAFDYLGTYTQSDTSIAFNFADGDLAGAWTAAARFRGDTLRVSYNDVMLMADFVGGPYLLQR